MPLGHIFDEFEECGKNPRKLEVSSHYWTDIMFVCGLKITFLFWIRSHPRKLLKGDLKQGAHLNLI